MPTVSIVVPFHNAENHIGRCIESLLGQTYPHQDYEIIFVDNNSTDQSAEIVRQHDRIRLLAEAQPGAYAARNRGIVEARGEIVALTDPDCICVPQWLESVTATLQTSEVGIVLGLRRYASTSTVLAVLASYEAEKARFVTGQGIKELYYGYTNNMAVRRSVFERVGLFPERLRGGDTIFVRRAVNALGTQLVRYCPAMEVCHLEITRLQDYYQKHAIYGQSNELLGRVLPFRPLLNRERWRVFRQTVRLNQLSSLKSLLLLGLLLPGAFYYEWGRWRGQHRKNPGP